MSRYFKTVMSSKGQVVIPKPVRDSLGLRPGTILRVRVEKGRVVLEPVAEPPLELFVGAGSRITEPVLSEAKRLSDKARKLLEDLGVELD
ncbi:MAG: AbrB/MazE/SpoVT family DNA-binding domain-containing protein [Desulfurococcales archaeon]|nr:AbrB/MazE/SpoVT family DNA-binding domain-containing protein [Desulfurococcales archaeon]